jgi:release factor glutamine methyltransferase
MADADENWTVRRLLDWTRDYLGRHGSESPRLDAEVLLSHILARPRVLLYTQLDDVVDPEPRAKFRDLIRRRAEGTPVAYLVGKKEFFSLTFRVSPAVIIPRPDTEYLVVDFLHVMKTRPKPRCVDVGTGSGAIALACLHQHPTARFIAIDLSPDALSVARENAESLGLAPRVDFRLGDLLQPVLADGPFDAILSNPPYVARDVISTLEAGVRDHEPHLALDGGPDGLEVVRRLIREAVPLLAPGGHLILEIGSDQEAPVRALLASRPELDVAPTVRDGAQHPRVLRATRKS